MDKKIALMWAEALRSKKYRKTTGALKVVKDGKSRFSALGVLCDLYQQNNDEKLEETPDHQLEAVRKGWRLVSIDGKWDNGVRGGLSNRPALPEKVRKWAGIKTERCEFMLDENSVGLFEYPLMHVTYSIPKVNDIEARWNFKKIAQLIEVVYEKL